MSEQKIAFLKKYLPAIAVVGACLFFGSRMRPHTDAATDFHYRDYGLLPVIDGGRYKPMHTVAASKLMVLTHRQDYYDYDDEKRYPGTKWLLDVQTTPLGETGIAALLPNAKARGFPGIHEKIFRIENDEVIHWLGLTRRSGLRWSLWEIMTGDGKQNNIQTFQAEVNRIEHKNPKSITLREAKIMELSQHIQQFQRLCSMSAPLMIPADGGDDQWLSFGDAFQDAQAGHLPEGVDANTYKAYAELFQAYDAGDKATFNTVLKRHLTELRAKDPDLMRAMDVEIFFTEFSPFYNCLLLYGFTAVVCCLAWLIPTWTKPIQRACYAMMAVGFLVHLSGLIIRMILSDRMFVFVTNLYSSAVFIGLGAVLFCMISEYFFRNGIAIVVGCVGGFLTLIIAHMLSFSGDTLEMMQAVLDTNFWLATHVTCITLGYVSAFVAGLMGISYILLGMFTNMLRKDGSANLTRMTYGVLCAGMFLSFVGTVLGGLWADYSWGRFWGWDPKENGALLIVIWIALILHARWGGMVKHRGIAVLSVLGIVVTSWSWFGTNFLGVGLHSYGFRQGAMTSLILIDLGFLAIAGLGLVPLNMWQSFRPASAQAEPMLKAGPRTRPAGA